MAYLFTTFKDDKVGRLSRLDKANDRSSLTAPFYVPLDGLYLVPLLKVMVV